MTQSQENLQAEACKDRKTLIHRTILAAAKG